MQDKVVILVEKWNTIEECPKISKIGRNKIHQGIRASIASSHLHKDQSTVCGHDAAVGAGHGSGLQAIVAGENPPLRQLLG